MMASQDIEIAVALHFCYRRNVIVPNISWGMGLHYEADVVVLRPSDYAIEIEIKISASDIRADRKKKHQHDSNLFRELWFAVPEKLEGHPDIPCRAGILSVDAEGRVESIRSPQRNRLAVKWSQQQRNKLYHLASMRTWSLKKIIARTTNTPNPAPDPGSR